MGLCCLRSGCISSFSLFAEKIELIGKKDNKGGGEKEKNNKRIKQWGLAWHGLARHGLAGRGEAWQGGVFLN